MSWYICHSDDVKIRNELIKSTNSKNNDMRNRYKSSRYALPSDKFINNLNPFKGQTKDFIDGYLEEIQQANKEVLKNKTDLSEKEINDILVLAAIAIKRKYGDKLTTDIVYREYPLYVNNEYNKIVSKR